MSGFGAAADCKSLVGTGDRFVFFLTNTTGAEAPLGDYPATARYDDLYGATALVTTEVVTSVMDEIAPEGGDCAQRAGESLPPFPTSPHPTTLGC